MLTASNAVKASSDRPDSGAETGTSSNGSPSPTRWLSQASAWGGNGVVSVVHLALVTATVLHMTSQRHTHDALLDATRECVLEVGVRRTTLTDVAKRAGREPHDALPALPGRRSPRAGPDDA